MSSTSEIKLNHDNDVCENCAEDRNNDGSVNAEESASCQGTYNIVFFFLTLKRLGLSL